MKTLYAGWIMAERDEGDTVMVHIKSSSILATNHEEAEATLLKGCFLAHPVRDGFRNHQSGAQEVTVDHVRRSRQFAEAKEDA